MAPELTLVNVISQLAPGFVLQTENIWFEFLRLGWWVFTKLPIGADTVVSVEPLLEAPGDLLDEDDEEVPG
jgi:hypothetical protein